MTLGWLGPDDDETCTWEPFETVDLPPATYAVAASVEWSDQAKEWIVRRYLNGQIWSSETH